MIDFPAELEQFERQMGFENDHQAVEYYAEQIVILQRDLSQLEEIFFVLQDYTEKKQFYEENFNTMSPDEQAELADRLNEMALFFQAKKLLSDEGDFLVDPSKMVESRDIMVHQLTTLHARYESLMSQTEEAYRMRMMLENLVGPDMQQQMLSQLDPQKLVDPEINRFL